MHGHPRVSGNFRGRGLPGELSGELSGELPGGASGRCRFGARGRATASAATRSAQSYAKSLSRRSAQQEERELDRQQAVARHQRVRHEGRQRALCPPCRPRQDQARRCQARGKGAGQPVADRVIHATQAHRGPVRRVQRCAGRLKLTMRARFRSRSRSRGFFSRSRNGSRSVMSGRFFRVSRAVLARRRLRAAGVRVISGNSGGRGGWSGPSGLGDLQPNRPWRCAGLCRAAGTPQPRTCCGQRRGQPNHDGLQNLSHRSRPGPISRSAPIIEPARLGGNASLAQGVDSDKP